MPRGWQPRPHVMTYWASVNELIFAGLGRVLEKVSLNVFFPRELYLNIYNERDVSINRAAQTVVGNA